MSGTCAARLCRCQMDEMGVGGEALEVEIVGWQLSVGALVR